MTSEARAEALSMWPEYTGDADRDFRNGLMRHGFMAGAAWATQAAEERAAALTEVVKGLLECAINELGIDREWDELYDRGRALTRSGTRGVTT